MDRKRLGSFVLGGLAGLLAGVLLAPKSGRETRGSIANRADEARQRGSESYFDARERVSERISSTREPGAGVAPRVNVAGDRASTPPPETPAGRPHLRDVSKEGDGETSSSDRSEALRRKIRETREKLREVSDETPEKPEGDSTERE